MFFCQNIRKTIFFESPTQGKEKIIISFLTEEENISSLFNEKRRIFFKTNFSKVTEKKFLLLLCEKEEDLKGFRTEKKKKLFSSFVRIKDLYFELRRSPPTTKKKKIFSSFLRKDER